MARSTPEEENSGAQIVDLDERRFLLRHCQGDRAAFSQLVAQFRRPVFGYLVRCGVPTAARDDLFQEIFLKVHGAAKRYQPDRPLKPWIFTIVANTVRSHYRKLRVRQLVMHEANPPDRADGSPGSAAWAEARETAAWLQQEMACLPLAQREVVSLCCVERMDQKAAADVLELPLGTVKTHLHRARAALARQLARRNAQSQREVSS